MCTYAYIRFVIGLFSFFVPLEPRGLIIVQHFQKSAAMPQYQGQVRTLLKPLCSIYTVNPQTLADPP